ncbi:amidohydrolase [Pasteurella skyensis]|uniref:Amidohydrolase n=1 Tax=Phocoenobacter skyensis TaxID=97481 RepID=A0AAJ6NAM7_9PAST|nr:amidohydrolase [Pasteurella skyensis]MDP8163214.1 amidohydrolase [Pasteurella skyensis]MDP8173319.1 amidohydrolase [Pasteurella skyensis]MDP8176976.1 amidohydrolase [Pasteurella skyensis]MDP8179729.1 amidohydrolase [Pasteurella skyensis]MDP8182678.1 amidohydrolase [Pasteurella skyensis]
MKKSLLTLLVIGLTTQITLAVTSADMVFKNGDILTENSQQPYAEAIAINNGKIVFVGSNDKVAEYIGKNTKVDDLQGKFVMPSFIDSHAHPGMVAVTSSNGELAKYQLPTTSKEDTYAYLRKIAKENPNLPFLMVGTWSNPLWGVKGPDRKEIDEIFPNTVVILLDSSGHSYWLNSAALAAFGIDENTPDLKEGLSFFVKDENGRKTGWVKEFALMPYIAAAMPQVDSALLAPAVQSYLDGLAKKGVASVMDAGNFNNELTIIKAVQLLDKAGKLPVRYDVSHHLYMPDQLKDAVKTVLDYRKQYSSDLLTFNTIKIHFDGVNEINTGALLEDFANEKGNKGGMLYSEDELKDLLLEMAPHKMNLHLHTVGDRAVRTALNAYEKAQKEYGKKLPVEMTLSHMEVVNPGDMNRFKELGVHANFTPHWFGGTTFKGSDVALGPERYSHNQPAGSVLKAGASVGFSSDVVSKPQEYRANPFMGVQMGATRQETELGKDTPVFGQKDDRISVADMIKGYTINNAKAMGIADKTGSLEVGKSADFMVLPSNLIKMDVYKIKDVQPTAVYFQGKAVQLDKK